MSDQYSYFDYLRKRSRLGWFYRRFWLYPRLNRKLRGRALDVGCGIGDMLRYRPDSIGADINPRLVAWCRSLGLDVHQMQENSLPFRDAEFESVILDNVLEHIDDPQALLKEIKRVLTPGGVLLVGVPGTKGYQSDSDHKIYYDEDALVKRMNAADFRKMDIIHMPFKLALLDKYMKQYCIYGIFEN